MSEHVYPRRWKKTGKDYVRSLWDAYEVDTPGGHPRSVAFNRLPSGSLPTFADLLAAVDAGALVETFDHHPVDPSTLDGAGVFHVEPAPAPAEAAPFKVGDRVRVVNQDGGSNAEQRRFPIGSEHVVTAIRPTTVIHYYGGRRATHVVGFEGWKNGEPWFFDTNFELASPAPDAPSGEGEGNDFDPFDFGTTPGEKMEPGWLGCVIESTKKELYGKPELPPQNWYTADEWLASIGHDANSADGKSLPIPYVARLLAEHCQKALNKGWQMHREHYEPRYTEELRDQLTAARREAEGLRGEVAKLKAELSEEAAHYELAKGQRDAVEGSFAEYKSRGYEKAWIAVMRALHKARPCWMESDLSGIECATKAIAEIASERDALTARLAEVEGWWGDFRRRLRESEERELALEGALDAASHAVRKVYADFHSRPSDASDGWFMNRAFVWATDAGVAIQHLDALAARPAGEARDRSAEYRKALEWAMREFELLGKKQEAHCIAKLLGKTSLLEHELADIKKEATV
jgi:hypothetical protein